LFWLSSVIYFKSEVPGGNQAYRRGGLFLKRFKITPNVYQSRFLQ